MPVRSALPRVALLLALPVAASATKPMDGRSGPPPPAEAAGCTEAAHLRIVSPRAGARLSQTVEIVIDLTGSGFRSGLWFGVDEERPVQFKDPADRFVFDTTTRPIGRHHSTFSIDCPDGRTLSDTVEVFHDNPPFKFESYALSRQWVQNGGAFWIDLRIEGETAGLKLTADFSRLDSRYVKGAERVEQVVTEGGGAAFRVHYRVADRNTVPDGQYTVPVVARDTTGAASYPVDVSLRNLPPPPFDILTARQVPEAGRTDPAERSSWNLASRSEDRLPPVSADGAATVTVVEGDGQVLDPDREAIFRVRWAATRPPVTRLVVQPVGFAGYYSIPVAPDQTEATLHVTWPSSSPPSRPASMAPDGSLSFELSTQVRKALSRPAAAHYRLRPRAAVEPFPPKGTRR